MAVETKDKEKLRKIVNLLPKENCGKCGFENCGKFALAVAEGKASPFGCHENPSAGYEISKVLGVEAPEEVKVPAGYPGYSQTGVSTGTGMEQGRGPGQGHGRGHHGHHGKGGGRGGHRQSGRHHAKQHSHSIRKILGRFV